MNGRMQCWCGAVGRFEELFDFGDAMRGCGGLGTIECLCGGDFCVCHHHGSYECDGCEDCREPIDNDDAYYDELEEPRA